MARRRSIYETGAYQTPLADFLDEIPDYFIKWEALKQGEAERKEAKTFRDKQYSDAVEQQRKNNEYRQEQADKVEKNRVFDNHTKLMQGMSDVQKVQYIDKVIKKDPTLKDYMDFSQFDDFSSTVTDANTTYDKINDDVDDFRGTSTMSMFPRYQDVASAYQKLQDMEKNVRGTDLEVSHAKDLKYVGELKKSLETLSGREMAEKDMPETMQRQFSSIVKSNDADYKSLSEAADELSVYADYNPKTRKWDKRTVTLEEFSGGQAGLDRGYNSAIRAFENAESRYRSSSATRNTFTKQQGLFYPEITTAQQQEELDVQSEARTSWFNENEKYINTNPELAELALQYLGDPTNADRFSALQEATGDAKSWDVLEAELESELVVETEVDETKVVETKETREPYEIGAKETATEFEPGADITDEDVEAVLADVRETTGFYPEGDAPREPKSELKLPIVAEPLTARGDKDIEEVVAEQEKKIAETPLFPEPLVETGKYDISDIAKGGTETGKVRRYTDKALGENLLQLKDLRDLMPEMKEAGQKTWVAQSEKTIAMLEKKIKDSIGKYINPDTGEFSNAQYTERIYKSLKRYTFPELQMREIKDLLRALSIAKPYSKKVKKTFQVS